MGDYRLSENAEADLYRTWLYGLERWGLEQANTYYAAFIQHFVELADNPSLRDTVLPWTSVSGTTGFDTHGLDESHHPGAEDRVSVEYQVLRRRIEGERLTQLLDHPCRSRIKCRVEM